MCVLVRVHVQKCRGHVRLVMGKRAAWWWVRGQPGDKVRELDRGHARLLCPRRRFRLRDAHAILVMR